MLTPSMASEERLQKSISKLTQLEREFASAEAELLRKAAELKTPLFARRRAITNEIPRFWWTAIEQCGSLDDFIQPDDAIVLTDHLKNLYVSRPDGKNPRSLKVELEFSPNKWFSDTNIEKMFEFRAPGESSIEDQSRGAYVSVPVKMSWKDGMDLTKGATDAAVKAAASQNGPPSAPVLKSLDERIGEGDNETEDDGTSPSFFAWLAWQSRELSMDTFPAGEQVLECVNELFEEAVDYFNQALEPSDDEEEEIDLENSDIDSGDTSEDSSDLEDGEPQRKKMKRI